MTLSARLRTRGDDRSYLLEFLKALEELKKIAERCPRQGEAAPKEPECRRS